MLVQLSTIWVRRTCLHVFQESGFSCTYTIILTSCKCMWPARTAGGIWNKLQSSRGYQPCKICITFYAISHNFSNCPIVFLFLFISNRMLVTFNFFPSLVSLCAKLCELAQDTASHPLSRFNRKSLFFSIKTKTNAQSFLKSLSLYLQWPCTEKYLQKGKAFPCYPNAAVVLGDFAGC